jgi:hypothetical protein
VRPIILHRSAGLPCLHGRLSSNVSCLMPIRKAELQSIYLAMVAESVARLRAAQSFQAAYTGNDAIPELEAAILQVRKALESIALASIAPNKSKYESFRAKAAEQPDYTKDYHAGKIFQVLNKINKNFYPLPLVPATPQPDGTLHFERKASGYLTKKRFESFYDRLGKHLHAHNPWGNSKNLQNLAAELPTIIGEAFSLLELHVTFIQTPEFSGAWVVEANRDGTTPRVIIGEAAGEFVVTDS